MPVSTKKAVIVAWLVVSFVAVASISLFAFLAMVSNKAMLPKYLAVPLVVVLLIAVMALSFHLSAIRWLRWSFKNTSDVYELEKALHISGFGAYSPRKLQKKHPEAFAEIMARFKNYEFVDDTDVPTDIFIYNREFYQSWHFIFGSSVSLCLLAWFIYSPTASIGVLTIILFCLVAGLTIHEYHKISDRSPQLTLNDNGIWHLDNFIDWHEVKDYQIIGGETSYLEVIICERKSDIDLDYLNISKVRLNHLLHVHRQRHLKAHSSGKP